MLMLFCFIVLKAYFLQYRHVHFETKPLTHYFCCDCLGILVVFIKHCILFLSPVVLSSYSLRSFSLGKYSNPKELICFRKSCTVNRVQKSRLLLSFLAIRLIDLHLETRYGKDFQSWHSCYCCLVGYIDGKFQMDCQGSYVSDFKCVELAFHSQNGHDHNLDLFQLDS